MSHSQGNDKIYEELRGYFPPEYDLTPDELEKEIELENKKREIALGMMRVHHIEDEAPASPAPKGRRSSVSAMHTDRHIPLVKEKSQEPPSPEAEEEKHSSLDDIIIIPLVDDEDIGDTESGSIEPEVPVIPEIPEEEPLNIPEAEDVSENELFQGYEPLNDLFDELEDTTPAEKKSDSDDDKTKKQRSTVNWFFDFLEVFSVCIACIIIVFAVFFRLTRVTGESMEDTLYEGEYLVVSDFFYEPKAGDIVVIQNTALTNELLKEPLVKRVIAVGGQSVDISVNGTVTVTDKDGNSEILDQSFTKKQVYAGISGHYSVPEGYVFVMGDNRNHSTDSRSPLVGVVDERCIFGKAVMRILPFSEFTVFENPYKN